MIDAESSQEDMAEELEDSLERIRRDYNFKEGHLEKIYDSLSDDYNSIANESEALSRNLKKAEDVADDLFQEWKDEAMSLDKRKFRNQSLKKLRETRNSFQEALASMKIVEQRMIKVLKKFHDHVIFIKHNLNAKIVGNLEVEMKSVSFQMKELIKKINISRAKAQTFIDKLN